VSEGASKIQQLYGRGGVDCMNAPAPCLRRVIIPGHVVLRPLFLGRCIAHRSRCSQPAFYKSRLYDANGGDTNPKNTQGAPVSLAPSHCCTPPLPRE
jgi:hypothetical protein